MTDLGQRRTLEPTATTPAPAHLTIARGSGEWSALYIDGNLDPDSVGDHYVAEERAMILAGIATECTDDFMRGGHKRHDVAPTWADVIKYRTERESCAAAAAALRSQAASLLAQAEQMEGGKW